MLVLASLFQEYLVPSDIAPRLDYSREALAPINFVLSLSTFSPAISAISESII
jgi:hypothetical protein